MKMKTWLIGLAWSLAVTAQGAISYGTQTIANVVNDTETAVTVGANATLSLSGTNSFAAATLTLGAGAKLVCADGVESAVIKVKEFNVGANCVVDEGVTLVGDFVSETVKGKTFTVNGVVKSANQIYSNTGLSIFKGTGTIWADNLSVRNGNQKALDNSAAGQLSFYNDRLNLRGTGSNKSIVERQWGHFRFQNAVFGFWGKDTQWNRAGEGTKQTRIIGQNSRIVFDTLDAEDGVTPRTFTWKNNCVLPDVQAILVVKTNPGTMVVEFNLASYLTGGTRVEGGTFRNTVAAPVFNGPVSVVNEGSLLDLPSANAALTFNGSLTLDQGTMNAPTVQSLTVAGAFALKGVQQTIPQATSAKFSGAVTVSDGELRLPAATSVTCGGALSIANGTLAAPNAAVAVAGKLTLGTNAVVSVVAGKPMTVTGGAVVTGPATVTFELPADSVAGVYPVIQGFGTDTAIDELTLNLSYSGALESAIRREGADIVAVLTAPPLTWKGGDGTWTDINWLTPDGETVGWSAGATARLPAGTGTIALPEDISAGYLDVMGDWTLTGSDKTLAVAMGILHVDANGRLACGVTLNVGDTLTKSGDGRLDLTSACTAPTTVNVSAGTLGLAGDNDWSATTVILASGATLGASAENATVNLGDFQPQTGAVVGAGLTVNPLAKIGVGNLNGVVVNGSLCLVTNSISWNTFEFGTATVSGTGTVQVQALGASSANATILRNLTLAFTGSHGFFVGRMWGFYDFYDTTFTFAGGDLVAQGGDTKNNAWRFHGLCTFDTLDAADGATPRTITFGYNPSTNIYTQIGAADGGVRKINAGVLVFGVPAAYTGETRVEGGTFIHRERLDSSLITVRGAGTVFSNQCANASYLRYTAPVTLLEGACFAAEGVPQFTALTVGGNSRLAFPLAAGTALPATTFSFTDEDTTLTFELEMPTALPKGSYTLLEGTGIHAADAARFAVAFPQGLPDGVSGRLLVCEGAVRYRVTESALAATSATWLGTGDTPNWSDGANWDLAAAPDSGLSLLFAGTQGLTNTFDLAAKQFANLTFSAAAGPFAFTGSDVLTLAGSVVNRSQSTQTFDVPVAFSAETAVLEQAEDAEGTLDFRKDVSAAALRLNGAVQAEFNGATTVNGAVTSSSTGVAVSGSGSLVADGNLEVAGSTSLAWGVGSSSFSAINLLGRYAQLSFTGGTTVFTAPTTANMHSGNLRATLTVGEGAKVHWNFVHSSQVYWVVVNGELFVHNWLSISPKSDYEWIRGSGTLTAKGIRIDNGSNLSITVPQLRLGEWGLCSSNYNGTCTASFGAAATTISPADSDFAFFSAGNLAFVGSREKGTETVLQTVDTNGVPRTVTISTGLAGSGAFAVEGAGTLALAPYTAPFTGALRVKDQATVSLQKSLANAGTLEVENGGVCRVDAAEAVLPKTTLLRTGGTLATVLPVTVQNPTFEAGALLKPIGASDEDDSPVFAFTGTVTLPAEGQLGFDLSELPASEAWTKVLDWSDSGMPEWFSLSKVAVLKAPLGHSGASYRFKATSDGLYVALKGFWILVR